MRGAILLLFLGVFASMAIPMCVGIAQVGGTTAVVMAEYAPTDEDRRLAAELQARAAAGGEQLEVSAIEIAHARRLGQLETVEEFADQRFPAVPAPASAAQRAETPARHADGAFYRDDLPAESAAAFPWGWAALAVGTLLASLGALAAGFLMLGPAQDDELAPDPSDAGHGRR